MTLGDVHVLLGWVVVVANGVVGAWALACHWLPRFRNRALWPATAIAEILIGVQVVIGVVNMQVNDLEVDGVHLFYGFIALFTVGIIYSYRQQLEPWIHLLYGLGGLFLMGLGLRSMFIPALTG